jgi:hypothetical protein
LRKGRRRADIAARVRITDLLKGEIALWKTAARACSFAMRP